jgi:mannose-6-phosphate isomerase
MGLDGKPRDMHIDKGKQVSNLATLPKIVHTSQYTGQVVEIVRAPYFTTLLYQLNVDNGRQIALDTDQRRFHILTSIGGATTITAGEHTITLKQGQTALIPANVGAYTLAGPARVLCSMQ